MAQSNPGDASLSYTVPGGGDAYYYAAIFAANDGQNQSTAGLLSQYFLNIDVADTVPPVITAPSLPAEGGTTSGVVDRFTLAFSKDMAPATVNNVANYSLQDSHGNAYHVSSPGYGSGLSTTCVLTDGPLQPESYTLTISGLTDRLANPQVPFTMHFTVVGVPPFILEDRSNDPWFSPTSLSAAPGGPTGTFVSGTLFNSMGNLDSVARGRFTASGHLDLAVLNVGANSVRVFLGRGDGNFQGPTDYAVGSNPYGVVVADFNEDGNADLAVSNYGSDSVSVLRGNGAGSFGSAQAYAVGDGPYFLAAADLNGDGAADLAVPNQVSNTLSVLLNKHDGTGEFHPAATYSTGAGSGPYAVAVGLMGVGSGPALVVSNGTAGTVAVFPNNGDGTFGAPTSYSDISPGELVLADLDGDGDNDVAANNWSDGTVSVLLNQGGTLGARTPYATGGTNPYRLAAADLNADGRTDLALSNYSSNTLAVLWGNGDGTFQTPRTWAAGSGPRGVTVGDFNEDSLNDVVVASWGGGAITMFAGQRAEPLVQDPAGSGLYMGYGRGNNSAYFDYDYWSFTGNQGQAVTIAVDTRDHLARSGRNVYLYKSDGGNSLLNFGSGDYGNGQSSPLVLPQDGTYVVLVTCPNYDNTYEYNLRVTLADANLQMETENNSRLDLANSVTLTLGSPGHLVATVAGAIMYEDAGDYYQLGNITAETTITLTLPPRPSTSPLIPLLRIYKADGTQVAQSNPGDVSLSYTIPSGGNAYYYAAVFAANDGQGHSTAGLLSQYFLNMDVADTVLPVITAPSLPAEGGTTSGIVDRFSLVFSKDMNAATVNNVANYSLQDSHGNAYHVSSPGYGSGLTTTCVMTDGPLQPESYTLTISGLTDRLGNPQVPFTQHFTVVGVPPFILEDRSNEWFSPTSLSTAPGGPTGTFVSGGLFTPTGNPDSVASGRFTSSGHLDLAVKNYGTNSVMVFLGRGDGTFQGPVDFAVGSHPYGAAVADFNGDGNADVAVSNYDGNSVSVLLGNGAGSFAPAQTYAAGDGPLFLAAADLNGDGAADLAVPDRRGHTLSVLLNKHDGMGGFQAASTYSTGAGSGPQAVAVGPLGVGSGPAVVVTNYENATIAVFANNGDGTFGTPTSYPVGDRPCDLVLADFDGDGDQDVATADHGGNTVSVLLNQGGTLGARTGYSTGGSAPYRPVAADFNGDGRLDLAVSNYNSHTLGVLFGNGDGTFQAARVWAAGNHPCGVTLGDFNEDGLPDVVVANWDGSYVMTMFAGQRAEPLAQDPAGSGLYMGYGRGNNSSRYDYDYWSFTGTQGQVVTLALDVPGHPSGSGRWVDLYKSDGSNISLSFWWGNYGNGQSSPLVLPQDGTYLVRFVADNTYEYNLRVTLADANLQMEAENNSRLDLANGVVWTVSPGNLRASLAGAVMYEDAGDYYHLGNLVADTTLTLTLPPRPSTSALVPLLKIYKADGTQVAVSNAGDASLSYTVPGGGNAYYYAAIFSANDGQGHSTAGLLSQYLLNIDVADTAPPVITAPSLPPEGGTTSGVVDRFSLAFSKDMNAATVNNVANYSLRDSHGNVYHVASPGYSSGLTTSCVMTDGPLQPESYTLTILGVTDRLANPQVPFTLHFSVVGVPPFILEDRSNDSGFSPTSLSPEPGAPTGRFTYGGLVSQSNNHHGVASGQFTSSGHLDVVEMNWNVNTVSVFLGTGDGTVQAPVDYAVGSNPFAAVVADFNGDGQADLAVTNNGGSSVSVLLGRGDGTFGTAQTYAVGISPVFVAAAGLNGDGATDLAVPNGGSDTVSVLLNRHDGTGEFEAAVSYSTGAGSGPAGVAVGSMGVGTGPALVVTNFTAGTVAVLPNHGDGTFGTPIGYPAGNTAYDVVLADLDGDGALDVAATNYGVGTVSVLLNHSGILGPKTTYTVGGSHLHCLVATELNGDGRLDLASPNWDGNNFGVLWGLGDGTFQTAQMFSAGSHPVGITSGDFNEDGLADVVIADWDGSYRLTLLAGQRAEPLTQDPAGSGLYSGYGRGNNSVYYDYDYWSFTGRAGQTVTLAVDVPGHPSDSSRTVRLYKLDGTDYILNFSSGYYGQGQSTPLVLPQDGNYVVLVAWPSSSNTYEYNLRVTLADPNLQVESENNGTVGSADPVTYTPSGNVQLASMTGAVGVANDLDYYNLGTVQAGDSILLSSRLPAYPWSSLDPVVSVYNAANNYVFEVPSGRPFDGVAQIDVTQTGTYYAVMRGGSDSGSITAPYILDIQTLPTGSIPQLPNLQATSITLPTGSNIRAGQAISFSYTVTNVGSLATPVSAWTDRAVLSLDTIYGNGDDVPLALAGNDGVFPHTGALDPGQSYLVTQTIDLPSNIAGQYHIIVQADHDRQVVEGVIGEGDNVTPTLTGGPNGNGTFTIYPDPGTLIVTRFVPTDSGFVARFSRDLDLGVLNLYDSASQTLGPADVTVTGASYGAVRGSLVVGADQRQITFVQTGGWLEPDTYTVTLFSGATRFRQPTGGTLDGNADGTPGDDYQTTFTVSAGPAGTVVIGLPDMARGAGQPVNVPNTLSGLPIRLSDATGVTSLVADLVYDPTLLNITAAALAVGVPADWSLTLDTATPGVAKARASGTTPLSGTDVDVVRLTAAVPNAAAYGAIQAIRLENVSLDGGAIAAVGDVAVHKGVHLGDADGSGIHSSADAFLTVQVALGLASGFAAHAWTDPRIVGDADGSGVLSAADAFLIVQEGLGLSEPFVPDNPHVTVTHVGGGVDPQFRIDENLPVEAGGVVTVPVNLHIEPAATNVGAFDFDLFFDPAQLTIQLPGGASAGADTAGWAVTAKLVESGHLRVGMVSATGQPLVPGLREIVRLQFCVEPRRTGWPTFSDGWPTPPTLPPPITDHRLPMCWTGRRPILLGSTSSRWMLAPAAIRGQTTTAAC